MKNTILLRSTCMITRLMYSVKGTENCTFGGSEKRFGFQKNYVFSSAATNELLKEQFLVEILDDFHSSQML